MDDGRTGVGVKAGFRVLGVAVVEDSSDGDRASNCCCKNLLAYMHGLLYTV